MNTIWRQAPVASVIRRVRGVRLALAGIALAAAGRVWQAVQSGAALHLASLGLGLTVAVVALRVMTTPTHIASDVTSTPPEVMSPRTPVVSVRVTEGAAAPTPLEARPTYVVAGSDEQAAEIGRALHDAMRDARDAGRALDEPYRNARVVIIATAEDDHAFRRAIDEAVLQRQIDGLPGMRVVDLRGSATSLPPPAAAVDQRDHHTACGSGVLRSQC